MSSEDIIQSVLSIVVVTNIILALVIFSRGLRSFTNLTFGMISMSCAIWGIAIIAFYSELYRTFTNWTLITHSSALLISFFFFIFSLLFPQRIFRGDYHIITLATIPFFIIIGLIFLTDFIIGDVSGYKYIINTGYLFYAFLLIVYFFSGFCFLFIQYRKAKSSLQKKQVLYVLYGSAIASTLAIIPDLIFPYLNIFTYTWFGPIFTLIMVISLFLAILKYGLFNIKVILTEIVSVIIVVALLLELFFVKSNTELILKSIVLMLVTFFAYLLINSVYREVSQREALTLANIRQENLIHIMNHQIKGYLGKNRSIFAEMMSGDYGDIPETAKPLITEGFNQSTKGVEYVQDILRGASAASGLLPFDMKPIDLKPIVIDVISQERPVAESRGLSFESHIADEDYDIIGDALQLGEVCKNLITNAIKYNSPNGFIKIDLFRKDDKITLSVMDGGVGVSDEDKPKLFTAGGMGKNSLKLNVEAAGFGLAFVKGVAEAHGGIAGYRPNISEKGSTFFIELPVKKS